MDFVKNANLFLVDLELNHIICQDEFSLFNEKQPKRAVFVLTNMPHKSFENKNSGFILDKLSQNSSSIQESGDTCFPDTNCNHIASKQI